MTTDPCKNRKPSRGGMKKFRPDGSPMASERRQEHSVPTMAGRHFTGFLISLITAAAWLFAASCTPGKPIAAGAGNPLRIVSLSPAMTRALQDLGLKNRIVGRSRFCEGIDHVTVVGDLIDVDYETLVRLEPTHLLIQPPATGTDAGVLQLAKERGWTIGQWRLAGLGAVRTMIDELPALLFPSEGEDRRAVREIAERLLRDIDAALEPDDGVTACGRTLLVESVDPVLAFGEGTYLDDMLTAMGGTNAIDIKGYPELTLEDVARLNPDSIMLIRSRDEGRDPMDVLGPIRGTDVAAVRTGRVVILAHPDALIPSSGLPLAAKAMKAAAAKIVAKSEIKTNDAADLP
jgi:ABC-type hemin transport system substrate-binding protein